MTAAEYVIDVLGGPKVFKGRTLPNATELRDRVRTVSMPTHCRMWPSKWPFWVCEVRTRHHHHATAALNRPDQTAGPHTATISTGDSHDLER